METFGEFRRMETASSERSNGSFRTIQSGWHSPLIPQLK